MNNKYEWLNKRYLRSVDQLRLWDENPRLNPDEKHLTIVDFVEDLIADEADKSSFFDLLQSISEGFVPADPIVVWRQENNGKYYVAEGNRRVIALKLLRNPNKAPKSIRRYVRKLANSVHREDIEKISVNIAPTFEDAEWYINQRNNASSLQRPWSRIQQQKWITDLYNKYSGDINKIYSVTKMTKGELENFIRVLHLLDLIKTDEVKSVLSKQEYGEAISHKFPVTILERFFSNKSVKERWGIEFENTDLKLKNKKEFLIAYSALIKNIISTSDSKIDINTRTITTNLDEILEKLPKVNLGEKDECIIRGKIKEENTVSIDNSNEKETNKNIVKNDPHRNKLIPSIYQLDSSDYRLNGLFEELKAIGKKYLNVKAASLRVFLDLAVLHYIQSKNIEEDIRKYYGNKFCEIVLAKRLSYIQERELSSRHTKRIVAKLLDDSSTYSLAILNGYIHEENTCYLHNDFVNSFWDFLLPLFKELLDIKEEKK